MKHLWLVLYIFILGCASVSDTKPTQARLSDLTEDDKHLILGMQLLQEGDPEAAITSYIDPVIAGCGALYNSSEEKFYSSRGMTETLYYLLKAAADDKSSKVVGQTCAEALYLKGYASLELGDVIEAEKWVRRALEMSPVNARYLSELGFLYQGRKDWEKALEIYRDAEEYAKTYSPESTKTLELGRAMRGVGYSLIEMGRLDDAEEKFRECLQLNKNDKAAQYELEYIEMLRSRRKGVIDI